MIAIYILCAILFMLATLMLVLFYVNDKAQKKEIKRLNKKVDYYIKVLEKRAFGDD